MLLINLLRRTYLATAALIAFSALVPKLTLAQPVPLPVPASGLQGFPQDDVERMHAAAARLYEGSSTGTIEQWRDPRTRDSGEVQLIRNFYAKGMPCRTLHYRIRYEGNPNRVNRYVLNWCRVPEGAWKIAELPRPR
jgi:hypothetical protein